VRYLEQAIKSFNLEEYRMVKNALRERLYAGKCAASAHPAKFLVPVYSWRERLTTWWNEVVRRGCRESNLFPAAFYSREATLEAMPGLKAQGLSRSGVLFRTASLTMRGHDLALNRNFCNGSGIALNYARVTEFRVAMPGCFLRRQYATNFPGVIFCLGKKFGGTPPEPARTRSARGKSHAGPKNASEQGSAFLFSAETFPGTDALLVRTRKMDVWFRGAVQGRLLVGTTDDEVTPATRMVVSQDEAE